jgi:hypothetical protein
MFAKLRGVQGESQRLLSHFTRRKTLAFTSVIGAVLLTMIASSVLADVVDDLQRRSGGRLSNQGANYLRRNWIAHSEPCRKVSDVGGSFWAITYGDGFEVYNCFRKCRGTEEVASYFLGIAQGDCDSFTQDGAGRRQKVCFPGAAGTLVQQHGAAIAIGRRNDCME